MSDKENKEKELNANLNINVPGLEDLASGAKNIAENTSKGLSDFLGSICMPVAEQFGELLSDQVKYWRHRNFVRYSEKNTVTV